MADRLIGGLFARARNAARRRYAASAGDFLWDRAAATAGRRRPLSQGRGRMAA